MLRIGELTPGGGVVLRVHGMRPNGAKASLSDREWHRIDVFLRKEVSINHN